VSNVLNRPPVGIERGELADTLTAIEQAGLTREATCAAFERGNKTTVSADVADCHSEWTTAEAAGYLQLSQRRVQEIAADLGGQLVGRQWRFPQVAVREYERKRRMQGWS